MAKHNYVEARTVEELAEALGLPKGSGSEIKLRSDLNDKIIETVQHKKITHAQVATLAKTSRTRITAIINRNTKDISTDLMLRVLSSLGVEARITFKKVA